MFTYNSVMRALKTEGGIPDYWYAQFTIDDTTQPVVGVTERDTTVNSAADITRHINTDIAVDAKDMFNPSTAANRCSDIAAIGNLYVAITSADVLTSNTYDTWVLQPSDPVSGATSQSIATNGTLFAVGVDTFGGPNPIATSPDGVTWTQRTVAITSRISNMSFVNGNFVCAGSTELAYSPDGITWTDVILPTADTWIAKIAYGGGKYIMLGYSVGVVLSSTDLTTWTLETALGGGYGSLIYSNGHFIALNDGVSSSLRYSPDGTTWHSAQSYKRDGTAFTYSTGLVEQNGMYLSIDGFLNKIYATTNIISTNGTVLWDDVLDLTREATYIRSTGDSGVWILNTDSVSPNDELLTRLSITQRSNNLIDSVKVVNSAAIAPYQSVYAINVGTGTELHWVLDQSTRTVHGYERSNGAFWESNTRSGIGDVFEGGGDVYMTVVPTGVNPYSELWIYNATVHKLYRCGDNFFPLQTLTLGAVDGDILAITMGPDSDLIYFVTSNNYIYSISISTSTITKIGVLFINAPCDIFTYDFGNSVWVASTSQSLGGNLHVLNPDFSVRSIGYHGYGYKLKCFSYARPEVGFVGATYHSYATTANTLEFRISEGSRVGDEVSVWHDSVAGTVYSRLLRNNYNDGAQVPRLATHWYELNTDSNDSSGTAHGTNTDITYSNGGAVFNGTTSKITLPISVYTAQWRTLEIVFELNAFDCLLFNLRSVFGGNTFDIRIGSSGQISYQVYTGEFNQALGSVIDINKKHYAVLTYNATTGEILGYLNGVQVAQSMAITSGNHKTGTDATIGMYLPLNDSVVDGVIYDVKLNSSAVTPAQIKANALAIGLYDGPIETEYTGITADLKPVSYDPADTTLDTTSIIATNPDANDWQPYGIEHDHTH